LVIPPLDAAAFAAAIKCEARRRSVELENYEDEIFGLPCGFVDPDTDSDPGTKSGH
jgi:hypothetical protein